MWPLIQRMIVGGLRSRNIPEDAEFGLSGGSHERSAEIKSACAKVPGPVEDCDRADVIQQLQDWAIELAEEVERRSEIVCSRQPH